MIPVGTAFVWKDQRILDVYPNTVWFVADIDEKYGHVVREFKEGSLFKLTLQLKESMIQRVSLANSTEILTFKTENNMERNLKMTIEQEQKLYADQPIERFTKQTSDYIPKSGVAEGFNSKICGGEWVRIDELSKLPEDEDAKIGKRYLDRDGNIVECVKNVCHTSTCVPCFFKHNDKNCITVSCHKEDRKDKEYVVFKLVEKSEIPTSTPKTITFASWKEMAKFLIDRELYTIRGRRYFSNSASLELRFYVQYPSGKPQELTNGWLDYNQTFYLSDPTVKPEITITYDEARHLIAQMKQVEFEQIAIK